LTAPAGSVISWPRGRDDGPRRGHEAEARPRPRGRGPRTEARLRGRSEAEATRPAGLSSVRRQQHDARLSDAQFQRRRRDDDAHAALTRYTQHSVLAWPTSPPSRLEANIPAGIRDRALDTGSGGYAPEDGPRSVDTNKTAAGF